MRLTLRLLPGEFAICRLEPQSAIPDWIGPGGFVSITRTAEELSIVCAAGQPPRDVRHEGGWRLLQLVGPFPFSAVGVLSSVLEPLATGGISVLAIGTFDTDYVLVKTYDLNGARDRLHNAGHTVLVTEV